MDDFNRAVRNKVAVKEALEPGAKNGSTVSVVEHGNGSMHKTILTLDSMPLSVVSVTTGAGVGGVNIYDFPEGFINILGSTCNISLAVQTEGDFTDATPQGDVGLGTLAPANADALGTDATDDNLGTATAFTMSSYAANVDVPPDSAAFKFDGTSTAMNLFLNALVDAGDIDDDTTTNLLVSGIITVLWLNMGDF